MVMGQIAGRPRLLQVMSYATESKRGASQKCARGSPNDR